MGSQDAEHGLVIRPFQFDIDYDTIVSWWKEHGSFAPKAEQLSPTGVVVESEGVPICAGWLYNTDSSICVFEFVVSNPLADKKQRDIAIDVLIETIKHIANVCDYNLIYTSVKHKKYIARLQNAGFIVADEGQTHIFYEVNS